MVEVTCHRCGKKTNEGRYVANHSGDLVMTCPVCRDTKIPSTDRTKKETLKEKYFCGRCRYKFKFNPKNGRNLSCPYCGKSDYVEEDRTDAFSIISELSNKDFDDKDLGPAPRPGSFRKVY